VDRQMLSLLLPRYELLSDLIASVTLAILLSYCSLTCVYTVAPAGEGNKKIIWVLLPFSCGRRGWGMRALRKVSQ
jgi:hypothetical protein